MDIQKEIEDLHEKLKLHFNGSEAGGPYYIQHEVYYIDGRWQHVVVAYINGGEKKYLLISKGKLLIDCIETNKSDFENKKFIPT